MVLVIPFTFASVVVVIVVCLLNPSLTSRHSDEVQQKAVAQSRDHSRKGGGRERTAARRRGLRGRGVRGKRTRRRGAAVGEDSNMNSDRDSSSEGTESNEEAIAAGMMHLAIACTHVERQATLEDRGAGKITPRLLAGSLGFCESDRALHHGFVLHVSHMPYVITRTMICAEEAELDSSDEELEEEEPLLDRRAKRKKPVVVLKSPTKVNLGGASSQR